MLGILCIPFFGGWAGEFPEPYNSEPASNGSPPSPADAVLGMALPDGFRVRVFAAEPDVRQPIALTTDPAGRVWVAENYTYAESKRGFDTQLKDRILVFEDRDRDGRFDRRTVFWDQASILTSLEIGYGGVFALCPPQLLFLPDRNGDDVPDAEPEVLLDGFYTTTGNRHTFANGLKWGPDGWLWGRIGISSGAKIGPPGTADSQRVEMRGGIWRYHPVRHVFEAVCHGTTNPWGLDWNDVGEPFFINTVIGHLWHAIPGAHFQRMHGEDVNPSSYGLIGQHADHYHFDTGAGWTQSRAAVDGTPAPGSDSLGGGHAHTGLWICQGNTWPDRFQGRLFTINLHGRRVNTERLERAGSGYLGRHEPDLLRIGDPWFRGLDLVPGPGGRLYISDWSDTGECHESDGVHRSSGRLYELTHGERLVPVARDLRHLPLPELIAGLYSPDEWIARQSRRVVADRAAVGVDREVMEPLIRQAARGQTNRIGSLRTLWALNAIEALRSDELFEATRDPDEHIRSWAIRLLVDDPAKVSGSAVKRLIELGREDDSAFVRLYLASALQRLPMESRWNLGRALVAHGEDAPDPNLGLLIWQGLGALVEKLPKAAVELAAESRHPVIRQFFARRMMENLESNPALVNQLLQAVKPLPLTEHVDLLKGFSDATRGWRRATAPADWATFTSRLIESPDSGVHRQLRELGVLFGDGRALTELKSVVLDRKADAGSRRAALKTLIDSPAEWLEPLLMKMVNDSTLQTVALSGLLQLGEAEALDLTVSRYQWVGRDERPTLIAAMISRPATALGLLDAISRGRIPRADLTPIQARHVASLNDAAVTRRLTEVWGITRGNEAGRSETMNQVRRQVFEGNQPADLSRGRQLYNQLCFVCHRLYGEGGQLGPDLTGSGRANLEYLLENILDPSAVVPADYRNTVVTMKDGRVLSGLANTQNERTVTLRGPQETVTVERREIESIQLSEQSLMPEGLLETLTGEDRRNLLRYLMQATQVPLKNAHSN